jgi:succinate-semialdehyde dehydrogenase/glutarate-semialdehyde dehydrogenase
LAGLGNAKIVTGGKRAAQSGSFPTSDATDVTTDAVGHHQETFGPVASALPLQDRRSGGQDGQRHRIRPRLLFLQPRHRPHLARRRALEYGIVGINEGIISTEIAPIGGIRKAASAAKARNTGIEEFLEVKYLCMGGHRPVAIVG